MRIDTNVSKDTENEKMERTSSGWKCKICNLCVKTSYSKKRPDHDFPGDLAIRSPDRSSESRTVSLNHMWRTTKSIK